MSNAYEKTAAIIVAAGRGTRAGKGLPKQWRTLAGRRVADWTVAAFKDHPDVDLVVLVVHANDEAHYHMFDVPCVIGGATRDQSVKNGLDYLADQGFGGVLIHDVARATISKDCITRVIDALKTADAAAPALAVTDALWFGADGKVGGTQSRDGLFRAQTPQGFRFKAIYDAHKSITAPAADDVEVARAAGIDVSIVEGDENNLKITTPDDFARAEKILRGQMDIRLGNGFDVHAFEDGDHVILCGVRVPHSKALKGHSDADVGMHAVTDAIYGALAEGDIGRHFPPSEAEWKDMDSAHFLKHAVALATSKGYGISNVDCTLMCERPKIGPHADAMMTRMAELMGLRKDQVSVKATTTERLGFTGREEGIASIATVTLVKP